MKLLNAYIDALSNSFNMKDEATRADYWLFTLMHFIVYMALSYIAIELGVIYSVLTIPATFTLMVRRMNDAGRSPWVLLVGIIPLVGALWVLYLLLQPSKQMPNFFIEDELAPV